MENGLYLTCTHTGKQIACVRGDTHTHTLLSTTHLSCDWLVVAGAASNSVPDWLSPAGHHSSTITRCCIDPQDRHIATVSSDRSLKLWDTHSRHTTLSIARSHHTHTHTHTHDTPRSPSPGLITHTHTHTLTTHHDLHRQVSSHTHTHTSDRSLKLWDTHSRHTTLSIASSHSSVVSSVCFTQDGRYVCTGSWDKSLQLWDVSSGTFRSHGALTHTHNMTHDGCVSSCAFSRDACLLVSGAYDRTVAVWDMKAICRLLLLKGHMDWVMDVAITDDRKWVVSCSKDATVRLWNIEQTEEIPAVIETRRTQAEGYQISKCEECARSFSVFRVECDPTTKCVLCRLKAPTKYIAVPPPCFEVKNGTVLRTL
ncbi:hypothetical protein ACEWY4_027595 [Coilia grayii]|uniref:Uncharacterized protein n=1 Tax=Coilia grayii TaxID=363190 RepID=A0ABD1IS21_9TELE